MRARLSSRLDLLRQFEDAWAILFPPMRTAGPQSMQPLGGVVPATSQAQRTATTTRRWQVASAVIACVLALAVAYGGIAVALSATTANGDTRAVAAMVGYAVAALGLPIVCGVHLARRQGWSRLRSLRFAALVSLLVHVVLLPVGLAAMSM